MASAGRYSLSETLNRARSSNNRETSSNNRETSSDNRDTSSMPWPYQSSFSTKPPADRYSSLSEYGVGIRETSSNTRAYQPPVQTSHRYDDGPFRGRDPSIPNYYCGDPNVRYHTGPFSYQKARCTSSYQRYKCRHTTKAQTQRAAGCAACAEARPNQCTPRPTEVKIPMDCTDCQPPHSDRRNEPGDWTPATKRDRVQDTLKEWEKVANPNEFRADYRGSGSRNR